MSILSLIDTKQTNSVTALLDLRSKRLNKTDIRLRISLWLFLIVTLIAWSMRILPLSVHQLNEWNYHYRVCHSHQTAFWKPSLTWSLATFSECSTTQHTLASMWCIELGTRRLNLQQTTSKINLQWMVFKIEISPGSWREIGLVVSSTKPGELLIRWGGPPAGLSHPISRHIHADQLTLSDTLMTDFGYKAAPVRQSSQLLIPTPLLWHATSRHWKWLWRLWSDFISILIETVSEYQELRQSVFWATFHDVFAVRKLLG